METQGDLTKVVTVCVPPIPVASSPVKPNPSHAVEPCRDPGVWDNVLMLALKKFGDSKAFLAPPSLCPLQCVMEVADR